MATFNSLRAPTVLRSVRWGGRAHSFRTLELGFHLTLTQTPQINGAAILRRALQVISFSRQEAAETTSEPIHRTRQTAARIGIRSVYLESRTGTIFNSMSLDQN